MRIRLRIAMTGVVVMWLMSVVPALPQLRPGPVVNKPDTSVELETSQVGGRGWNWYSSVNALRCSYGQAIVGISSKRGSVLDYVQLACADISCNQGGCSWKQYSWGRGAGDPNGGTISNKDVCPMNSVVAGFRGGSSGNGAYATDIQPECARLDGRTSSTTYGGFRPVVYGVLAKGSIDNNMYGPGNFGRTAQKRNLPPPRSFPPHTGFSSFDSSVDCSCMVGNATALSYAVGRWNVSYSAVQAFSMFCARDNSQTRATECRNTVGATGQ